MGWDTWTGFRAWTDATRRRWEWGVGEVRVRAFSGEGFSCCRHGGCGGVRCLSGGWCSATKISHVTGFLIKLVEFCADGNRRKGTDVEGRAERGSTRMSTR